MNWQSVELHRSAWCRPGQPSGSPLGLFGDHVLLPVIQRVRTRVADWIDSSYVDRECSTPECYRTTGSSNKTALNRHPVINLWIHHSPARNASSQPSTPLDSFQPFDHQLVILARSFTFADGGSTLLDFSDSHGLAPFYEYWNSFVIDYPLLMVRILNGTQLPFCDSRLHVLSRLLHEGGTAQGPAHRYSFLALP
jgi:hypothetical protein